MAREVIADIDFGTSGTVSLGNLGQGLKGLESQTVRTANVFTQRMFSMRMAATALIGSFSLAGVILGLKSFVIEIIKADAAFSAFSKSAEGLTFQFGALVRETFNVRGGLESLTGEMDRFTGLMRLASEMGVTEAGQGIIGKILFGAPGVGPILTGLKAVKGVFDQMTEGLKQEVEAEREAFDPKRVDQWEAAVRKAIAELPGPEGLKFDMSHSAFRLIGGPEKAERLPDVFNEILDPLREAAELTDQTTAGWEATEDAMARIEESNLPDIFHETSVQAQLAASAIVAIGESITQRIIQGGLTFKAVFADMLMAMVPVLLGLAAIHLLEWDFAGAAYAFAAAIAAAAAAKALGAGAQRSYGGQAATAPSGGGTTTNLQVSFAGPTFGFNEGMFARYLMDLQRRGERGGG